MTPEQIQQWARESCLEEAVEGLFYAAEDGLTRLAALAAAWGAQQEREQCALVCEALWDKSEDGRVAYGISQCIDAIRARSEKGGE